MYNRYAGMIPKIVRNAIKITFAREIVFLHKIHRGYLKIQQRILLVAELSSYHEQNKP